jgi:hypothetical protein
VSHVRVDSSVPRNRKFVQAGPAPSWLWLCGLAYCQEGLTDGFIPDEAIDFLGVKNARRLAQHLVRAGLWERLVDGWRVHDYLEHNRSASDIQKLKDDKREYAKRGGEASARSRVVKQSASPDPSSMLQQPVNPYVVVPVVEAAVVVDSKERGPGKTIGPRDVWFRELCRDYPKSRLTIGHLTEGAFTQQFEEDTREDAVIWEDMRAGLRNQREGYEWRVKGMIPTLEKWLREGRWRQRHDEAPASAVLSERTSRTLTSAAEFVKEGRHDAR